MQTSQVSYTISHIVLLSGRKLVAHGAGYEPCTVNSACAIHFAMNQVRLNEASAAAVELTAVSSSKGFCVRYSCTGTGIRILGTIILVTIRILYYLLLYYLLVLFIHTVQLYS